MNSEPKENLEEKLLEAVRKSYPPDHYIVVDQVRSDTSIRARIADALALGIWKSRSMAIEGFEFKTSRANWLQELKEPQKAEEIAQFCDRWWLVVPNPAIIERQELPENWGLYTLDSKRELKQIVPAINLRPKEPDRVFMGCLLKRILENKLYEAPKPDLAKEYRRGWQEGVIEGENRAISGKETTIEWLNHQLHQKAVRLELVEERLGFKLGDLEDSHIRMWGEVISEINRNFKSVRNPAALKPILEALRFANEAPVEELEYKFTSLKIGAEEIVKWITWKLEVLKVLKNDPPSTEPNP